MAVACASRFAVLKLEDDDIMEEVSEKTNQTKSKTTSKAAASSESKSKPKKKKKPPSDVAELQSLAFGSGNNKSKNKNSNHSANNAKGNTSTKQWEEWKKKDKEFVSETYEQDLQEALLLSKIDYEEKKDIYDAIQKSEEVNKNCTNAQKKKKKNTQKKEKSVMSLDEFQNLSSSDGSKGKIDALEDFSSPEKLAPIDESDFFDKIEEDAEKIISREHRQEMYKKMEPVEHSARRLQFEDELEKKSKQIRVLVQELSKLKEELRDVKARNKRLCSILAEGEMREKAEILIQMEQLTNVKDELTDQLNEYHVSLEQERSKVHALQTELKKCQNSKKDRRDSK